MNYVENIVKEQEIKKEDLKKWRKARGMTQKQLASYWGVGTMTIYNWEVRGEIPNYVAILIKEKNNEQF